MSCFWKTVVISLTPMRCIGTSLRYKPAPIRIGGSANMRPFRPRRRSLRRYAGRVSFIRFYVLVTDRIDAQ